MTFTDQQAIDIYLEAINREAVVQMCVAEHVLKQSEVDALRVPWTVAASAVLKQGKAAAEASGLEEEGRGGLKFIANMTADLYSQLPEDDRERRCKEALDGYRGAPL